MLGERGRIPILTTLHGTDITLVGNKPSYRPAVKLGLDKSDRLTAVSHWLARETCRFFSLCDQEIEVIYNFIDPNVFAPRRNERHRARFAGPDEKILIHISNFRPVKRTGDVIKVFAELCRRMPARLILIGDGPDRETAGGMAVKLGVADRIHMLGKQPAVEHYLPLADLFLFPSQSESFGLAALEAMACGVPVVGTRSGGLVEVVEDGVTGHLAEVGDVEAMTEAAAAILSDPERRSAMAEAARRAAVERFSAEIIIPQYEALYRRLIEQKLALSHAR
jgi:N-acetyl-alpha-D-glucosaminyl L-malate synthase BshA